MVDVDDVVDDVSPFVIGGASVVDDVEASGSVVDVGARGRGRAAGDGGGGPIRVGRRRPRRPRWSATARRRWSETSPGSFQPQRFRRRSRRPDRPSRSTRRRRSRRSSPVGSGCPPAQRSRHRAIDRPGRTMLPRLRSPASRSSGSIAAKVGSSDRSAWIASGAATPTAVTVDSVRARRKRVRPTESRR